jgi:hypothetical protein
MNKQQERKMLARRDCVCISVEHACERIVEFEKRVGVTLRNKR